MELAVLGFGNLAKEVIRQLKEYKAYGDIFRVYCVHVRRNSLSYGPNQVIEIVDKYGDGLRVYNDGYQATDYYTTVSSYEDWLVEQSATYDKIINCMSYNDDSKRLTMRLIQEHKTPGTTMFMPTDYGSEVIDAANANGVSLDMLEGVPSGDLAAMASAIVEKIKLLAEAERGGTINWELANRSKEWMQDAVDASIVAEQKMQQRLLDRRVEDIEKDGQPFDDDGVGVGWNTLDPSDIDTLYRFVINGEGFYKRSVGYDNVNKRLVVSHEMLDWFFSGHKMILAASIIFGEPELVPTSTRYVKYDSPESRVGVSKCPRTIIYSVNQQHPWPLFMDGRKEVIAKDEAILYQSDWVYCESDALKASGNNEVEYIEFHFAPDSVDNPHRCTCFDFIEEIPS